MSAPHTADSGDDLNRYQRKLALNFEAGLYSDLVKTNADWRTYIKNFGGVLFRHLMLELSTAEGCNSAREVRQEQWVHDLPRLDEGTYR